MGGFAMTFSYSMEGKDEYRSSTTITYEERADAGADSAKINLFSVIHRYALTQAQEKTHSINVCND
jgi:hypothetical protein